MLSNTVKQIRLSKGLAQKSVATGYLSQANYSKFENGSIEIPVNAFIGILNNLNLDFDELQFIDNGYKYTEEETIFREFFRSHVNDRTQLEKLVSKCDNYLAEHTDPLIIFIRQISQFLIDAIKNSDIYFNKEKVQHLLDLFAKKEHLYIKDLYVINSIFFLFPIEIAHLTMEYIETALKKYGDFQSINRLEVNLRMNYSLMLLKEGLEEMALQQLNKALLLVKKYKLSVQMGILYIRMGVILNNLKLLEKTDYIKRGLRY